MIYFLWAAVFFLALVIQGSLSLFDITPNLNVLLAFYAGIKYGDIKGMAIGAIIGIFEDSLSGLFLGPNLLSKGLIGYLSSFLYMRLLVWNPFLGMISISLFTFADGLFVFFLRSIFDRMPAGAGTALLIIAGQALFNAPFGLFLKPKKKQVWE
jgi:rod shape-determining protein MreD